MARARAAAACCCASRISTPPAAGRNSRPRSIRISPGSASAGKPRCGGSPNICRISRGDRKARGQGLIYPSFESRAEIAELVAQREASAPWPRDPDGAPLYPGAAKSLSADARARLIESGAPYALRLDMAAARARAGDLELDRARRRSRRRDRRRGRPAASVGRRHPGAQGDADQLSPLGRDRRRLAGRDGGGAGTGPVLVDQRAPAAAGAARPAAAGLPAPPPRPR